MAKRQGGDESPRTILITGASGGLGRALALAYSSGGKVLHLSGRNAARLEETATLARAEGAVVHTRILDILDRDAVFAWIAEVGATTGLDLVIANAGISGGTGGLAAGESIGEPPEQSAMIFAVNLDGVRHTVEAAIPIMHAQGRGQIALISSLAGFRGLPGSPTYSASKAAVRVWGEALRGALAPHGIRVNVICPGYITTAMTAVNRFRMPGLMSAENAAGLIQSGLARNKARVIFPLRLWILVWLLSALPPGWTDPIFSRMPKKAKHD